MPIRLVLAEDHYLVREGTRKLLEDSGQVRVEAAVGTATELKDSVRRMHAVQYVSQPAYTWQRLRAEQAEVFENPVSPVPDPNGWVRLRLEIEPSRVRIYVGEGAEPDLVVDRLGEGAGRRVGLWVGYITDGDFANLRITPR